MKLIMAANLRGRHAIIYRIVQDRFRPLAMTAVMPLAAGLTASGASAPGVRLERAEIRAVTMVASIRQALDPQHHHPQLTAGSWKPRSKPIEIIATSSSASSTASCHTTRSTWLKSARIGAFGRAQERLARGEQSRPHRLAHRVGQRQARHRGDERALQAGAAPWADRAASVLSSLGGEQRHRRRRQRRHRHIDHSWATPTSAPSRRSPSGSPPCPAHRKSRAASPTGTGSAAARTAPSAPAKIAPAWRLSICMAP